MKKLVKLSETHFILVEETYGFKNGDWNYEVDNSTPVYQFNYDITQYPGFKIIGSTEPMEGVEIIVLENSITIDDSIEVRFKNQKDFIQSLTNSLLAAVKKGDIKAILSIYDAVTENVDFDEMANTYINEEEKLEKLQSLFNEYDRVVDLANDVLYS